MSDAPPADPPKPDDKPADPPKPDDKPTDYKAEAEKWKDLARKHEERSKANATAQKELDALRQTSMTEQEKAVEAAKKAGEAEAFSRVGGRLVAAEIRAVAADRLDADQVKSLIEGLNLNAFLLDDGEVDTAKVTKFVDGIAPPGSGGKGKPDLGQGARGGNPGSNDMNTMIRRSAGRA